MSSPLNIFSFQTSTSPSLNVFLLSIFLSQHFSLLLFSFLNIFPSQCLPLSMSSSLNVSLSQCLPLSISSSLNNFPFRYFPSLNFNISSFQYFFFNILPSHFFPHPKSSSLKVFLSQCPPLSTFFSLNDFSSQYFSLSTLNISLPQYLPLTMSFSLKIIPSQTSKSLLPNIVS